MEKHIWKWSIKRFKQRLCFCFGIRLVVTIQNILPMLLDCCYHTLKWEIVYCLFGNNIKHRNMQTATTALCFLFFFFVETPDIFISSTQYSQFLSISMQHSFKGDVTVNIFHSCLVICTEFSSSSYFIWVWLFT